MARTKAAHPGQSRREPRKTVRKRPRPERETAAVKRQRKQETQATAQERKKKEWEDKWSQCEIASTQQEIQSWSVLSRVQRLGSVQDED